MTKGVPSNQTIKFHRFQYRGNILKIHSVKKEDRGTYYCVADNGIGKSARRNVAVEVEFPPDIQGGGQVWWIYPLET